MTVTVLQQQETITPTDIDRGINALQALDEELEARQHRGIYWTSPDENKLIKEWKNKLNGGS